MKNFKKFIAIVSTFAMICSSTVALADAVNIANVSNYDFFVKPATITQGTTEFTVEMGVYDITDAGKTIDLPQGAGSTANIYASLDAAAITAGIKSTEISTPLNASVDYSSVHDESDEYLSQFCIDFVFDQAAVNLNKNAPMATVKFSVPADIAPGTYKITFDETIKYDGITLTDSAAGQAAPLSLDGKSYDFVTVTAAAPAGPTIESKPADNGAIKLEYTNVDAANKTLEGKYIVMNSVETPVGLTAASRVIVKYEDAQNPSLNKEVEYGKTIFEYLGITGEGKTTTKGIKFGVVYEDANYKAANFTFTIK